MKNSNRAGISGKSFYVALSLCVAMVGAACFYAYTRTGKPRISSDSAAEYTMTLTSASTSSVTTHTTAAPMTAPVTAPTASTAAKPDDAEEAAAILRHTTEATTASEPPVSTPAPVEQAVMPTDGEIIQPFSCGELVKSPTTGVWQTHNGMDIAAPLGTEVVAVLDGTVSAVDADALLGVCVSILHADGTVTRYCNLNENLNVFAGQILERGTVIGTVGATAESESRMDDHLHFEVRKNDRYIDPAAFLRGEA